MEIIPQVHLVPDVIANPYLIIDPDGLTLIDAGLPGSEKKILKYLVERDFSPQDLVRIIITHADFDHVGGLAALKRATGARVYASQPEATAMARGQSSRRIRPAQLGFRVLMGILQSIVRTRRVYADEILVEGQVLPVLGGLRVIATPGHTAGHTSLFSPSTRVLFVGDSIVSRNGSLLPSAPEKTWDGAAAAASVRKQAALGATIVCPGHGPVVKDALGKMPAV